MENWVKTLWIIISSDKHFLLEENGNEKLLREYNYCNGFLTYECAEAFLLKDVKKRFNEAIYENQQEINIKDNIKLNDWYEKWMNVYKCDFIRENTKMHYNTVYKKHISPTLGRMSIQNITQLQIRELIKELKKKG